MKRRLIFAAIVSIFIAGCIPKLPGGGEVQNDKAEFIEGKGINLSDIVIDWRRT